MLKQIFSVATKIKEQDAVSYVQNMVSGNKMSPKMQIEAYCPLISISASLRNYLLRLILENI
jgi:hypothetical protein